MRTSAYIQCSYLLRGTRVIIFLTGMAMQVNGQDASINYDESKVAVYTPRDPLVSPTGHPIKTEKEWTKIQRPFFLRLFEENVYGRFPSSPRKIHFKVNVIDSTALNGKAISKQVTVYFTQSFTEPSMELLMYIPKNAQRPAPVFTGLNFYGNQAINKDPAIRLSERWIKSNAEYHIMNNRATEASRGTDNKWPVEEIIQRGYAVATAYYGDLEPDHPEGWKSGIRGLMQAELGIQPNEWGAIGAWAWGLCRIMDYLQTDTSVNAKQVVITGHSRLGKAALWAAANDTRFAVVVSNDSGEGGAALSQRWYGETIQFINTAFPHWFCPKYKEYNLNPSALPVDQHLLLALMVPRPLYIASAEDDKWADPKGEFLSASYAGPVYALFGKKGLGVSEMPAVNHPVGETIRYHIRTGGHDMLSYDWQRYMDFADDHFAKKK